MKIEDYDKYYIQGSDHYLIPKDVFIELFNEMINWREESEKQKEVIDKAIKFIEDTYYSKNTTDIDSIVLSSDNLIKLREILKDSNN